MKRRIPVMAAAVIATALIAGSCFEPGSSPCLDGSVCPRGSKCTATGDSCIPVESHCGDGVKDPDEVCDDGNVKDGDGCSHDCKSNETCGNHITDVAVGEVCDDGNTVSGDGCSANCQSIEGCGNGLVDPGEECDDHNDAGDDNCPPTCKIAFCGDGFVNDAGHREQCDDTVESVRCNGNCTWASCGDQVLNRTAGEECDLGRFDTRTCTHTCKISFCGDGYINGDAGEVCDDSTNGQTSCPYGTPACTACNATCTARVGLDGGYCGNFARDLLPDGGVEACDDTGNGRTVCPYGTPTCTGCISCATVLNLTGPYCGNLVMDPLPDGGTESCDDTTRGVTNCPYGTQSCVYCNDTCTGPVTRTGPYCGDDRTDLLPDGGAEQCDDPSRDAGSCQYGTASCTACSPDCTTRTLSGSYCGDGTTDLLVLPDGGSEECDDSSRDASSCQYGTPTCTACSPNCTFRLLTGPVCGDQKKDIQPDGGQEPCDDNTTGWTSCPYGTPTCTACLANCQGSQPLTGPYCGDGARTNAEVCDDGNSASCGTCSANCGQSQPGAAATGSIVTVDSSLILDGQTFTLDDGVNPADVFEFDKDGGVATGHVMVTISGNDNSVATTIRSAITGENNLNRLTIVPSGTNRTVVLTNTQPGSAGNQGIQDTVIATGFTTTGMSGGRAFDCPSGTGCVSNTDCANGLACQDAGAGLGSTCQ